MSTAEAYVAASPVIQLLRDCKFTDTQVQQLLSRLTSQIELGAIWSLAKYRGDDLAQLAEYSPEQKRKYVASFTDEAYASALEASASRYLTDFIDTLEQTIAHP